MLRRTNWPPEQFSILKIDYLGFTPVREISKDEAEAHRKILSAHPNPLMGPLITPPPIRRLRRKWIFDELN
jgi:hypothetical protein